MKIASFGVTPERAAVLRGAVLKSKAVNSFLGKVRKRLLCFEVLDRPVGETKGLQPQGPNRFRATFFDYTNNRTVIAEGSLARPQAVQLSEARNQPWPTADEFEEAIQILIKEGGELGRALKEGRLRPYRPMPPMVAEELPDGTVERIVAVGLLPAKGERHHEIAGVNLIKRSVLRFQPSERGRAPAMAAAHNPICGLPDAHQPITTATPGQAWVTVTQAGKLLWKFLVVRPAASSGTRGSGAELRYVDYRGKRVLYRAHVPILNVKYDGDACGPYRDRQDYEGMFQAHGVDPAPGFRLCPAPATTILDTGSDTGNFAGVAIFVQGQEVVIVSEMEAGWYRYISQWRLHADGTIRPRFGFSAVESSCVCTRHHHHAYWRLDFDIRTPGNNLVREFNDPPIIPGTHWHDKNYEIRRPRDPAHKRKWRVQNKATGDAYDLVPGPNDGVATTSPDWPYPKGDVWILRYHGTELDDGAPSSGWGPPFEANLDAFLNGEPINGQDVVIWYGAHFTHDLKAEPPGAHGHLVGPDLRLVKW